MSPRVASIAGITYSVGARRRSVEESEKAGDLISPAADLRSAGFAEHHLADPGESAYDLAAAAVKGLSLPAQVDAIIYNTCLPVNANCGDPQTARQTRDVKHLMDFPGSRLQADFGLSRAAVFGLAQQGCTGMLGSLRLAGALLATEPDWRSVLCVTADRFPPGASYEQSYNAISDSAAACVVTTDEARFRIVASHQLTNGGLHAASNDETAGTLFSFIPRLVRELLVKAGLTAADVDWVVPQNTNRNAWQILSRLLGIEFERVCQPALADIGHAISADNLINLEQLARSKRMSPGDAVLMVVAGTGLNWQATLLEVAA